MKRKFSWLFVGLALASLSGCKPTPEPSELPWKFEVGSDQVTEEAPDAGQFTPTFTINLKIVGGAETILYNGTVTLKSDTMWGSEFLKAAVTDKALAQEGIDIGFVTTLGDYVNNAEENIYWLYTVNGRQPDWGVNGYQMRDGDYMLWTYEAVDWEALVVDPERESGDWAFEVGADRVSEEAPDAGQYSPTYSINLKIVGGGDDVMFNGKVTLKSDTMWGSEFLKAAVTDKALAQDGIDVGFVTTLGDYVNNAEENIYWLYTVDGREPSWGVNGYQMRDGDYMLWTYAPVVW
ncbi:MAG TPA: DUF4430 domain-containing protein [Bacilli bacterium]|nr:DUF4430 domain-containing protein [Bacilli bacterium]